MVAYERAAVKSFLFPLRSFDLSVSVGLSSSPIRALWSEGPRYCSRGSAAHSQLTDSFRSRPKLGLTVHLQFRQPSFYSNLDGLNPKRLIVIEHGVDDYRELPGYCHSCLLNIATIQDTTVHPSQRGRLSDDIDGRFDSGMTERSGTQVRNTTPPDGLARASDGRG